MGAMACSFAATLLRGGCLRAAGNVGLRLIERLDRQSVIGRPPYAKAERDIQPRPYSGLELQDVAPHVRYRTCTALFACWSAS